MYQLIKVCDQLNVVEKLYIHHNFFAVMQNLYHFLPSHGTVRAVQARIDIPFIGTLQKPLITAQSTGITFETKS